MTFQTQQKFILSVCIPTYNRPKEFERMLKGILPQITHEVELVVRDDSPNDETKKIFDFLVAGKNINFNYIKGEKIGLDAANLFLIENARGKYVWWFSDDDEMRPDAIAKVLELVRQYPDISFIFVNCDVNTKNNPAIVRDDGFFKDRNEVLETLGRNIGFLSALLFRREDSLPALPLAKKHVVGFSFAGLVPIFEVLSGSEKFYFLKGPYILNHPTTPEEFKRKATKTGKIINADFDIYGVDFYSVVKEFEGKFKTSSMKKLLAENFARTWRGMAVAWVGGWDTPKGKRWKMFKLYWSYPEIWLALFVFALPLSVNRFFYRVYKIFFDHRKWSFGKTRAGAQNSTV